MGDPARFREFAKVIAGQFGTSSDKRIADVAGGKGYLQSALRCQGFRNIVTFDKRPKLAKPHRRDCYRYEWFTSDHSERFDLVVAMHPDQGTDHSILYGVRNRVPFVVCPCCILPSAATFWANKSFAGWVSHLKQLAEETHTVSEVRMPISGRNLVLIGTPKN